MDELIENELNPSDYVFKGGQCFEYQWRTGPWRGSSRHVWCQRSDGLNVTGEHHIPMSCLIVLNAKFASHVLP